MKSKRQTYRWLAKCQYDWNEYKGNYQKTTIMECHSTQSECENEKRKKITTKLLLAIQGGLLKTGNIGKMRSCVIIHIEIHINNRLLWDICLFNDFMGFKNIPHCACIYINQHLLTRPEQNLHRLHLSLQHKNNNPLVDCVWRYKITANIVTCWFDL